MLGIISALPLTVTILLFCLPLSALLASNLRCSYVEQSYYANAENATRTQGSAVLSGGTGL
jgi:hypothetical protein